MPQKPQLPHQSRQIVMFRGVSALRLVSGLFPCGEVHAIWRAVIAQTSTQGEMDTWRDYDWVGLAEKAGIALIILIVTWIVARLVKAGFTKLVGRAKFLQRQSSDGHAGGGAGADRLAAGLAVRRAAGVVPSTGSAPAPRPEVGPAPRPEIFPWADLGKVPHRIPRRECCLRCRALPRWRPVAPGHV